MNCRDSERERHEGDDEPDGDRKPATPDEERELEKEELESFRRRKEWSEETFGGEPQSGDDQRRDEPESRKRPEGGA